ncbi:MAG TPA: hypothetical protein VFQ61_09700 [Polyangiaceae bacterium]|nr:hypothetical protein [Polyangiaceae bacterium]
MAMPKATPATLGDDSPDSSGSISRRTEPFGAEPSRSEPNRSEPSQTEQSSSEQSSSELSGVRPSVLPPGPLELPEDVASRFDAALAAHARTEAALTDLSRTVKFLSASISSIRDAHQRLGSELGSLLGRLQNDDPSRALKRRIQHLEHVVVETSRSAARERDFLVADHDAFIFTLISEHEREIAALRERMTEFEPHSATRLTSTTGDLPDGPERG